ncbi:hypothetical protein POM88_041234 [Heracleum sosnowskyi]|uniref:ATPase AAA-type core domain-containing protein n=1 Tax=Heracleum sosnowskyi TaxID=360622 RepID=A0AAD8MB65_9APIA|nr:hypothetical protein POM88_041234 [Heracleum sosnowskyi]
MGLWSSCGDERIIVFSTNHKDRLDPALLRPGHMDMHINMSYYTPSAQGRNNSSRNGRTTPAEMAEQLMKSKEADVSIGELVKFLQDKKIASSETTAEGGKVEDAILDGTCNDEKITKENEKKRVKNTEKKR